MEKIMHKVIFFFAWMEFLTLIGSPQSTINTLSKTEKASDYSEPARELRELGFSNLFLNLPEGGITQLNQPKSVTKFVHHKTGATLTIEVGGAKNYYEYWKKGYTVGKDSKPAAYKIEALPRTDDYLFYIVTKSEKQGFPKPNGKWKEFYLLLRLDELAALMLIELPPSSLEKGDMSIEEVKKIFNSARLMSARIGGEALMDPRIKIDLPESFVRLDRPTLTFNFKHERKPLNIAITLRDVLAYKTQADAMKHSARVWKPGKLLRTDEYSYYYVLDSYPEFTLVFHTPEQTVEVNLDVPKSSLDKGDVKIDEIERILSSARLAPP